MSASPASRMSRSLAARISSIRSFKAAAIASSAASFTAVSVWASTREARFPAAQTSATDVAVVAIA
jgi:hypothetical protein